MERTQKRQLGFGFHSLCSDFQLKAVCQENNRGSNGGIIPIGGKAIYKGPIFNRSMGKRFK